MLQTVRTHRGMVTAPHHLAARAGLRVLEEGGNAVEAMIAAAATIAVVYPHMNGLGGDNFWLVHAPGRDVVGIDACGAAAANATLESFRETGHDAIPGRGPLAALTVAGAVSGWQAAHDYSTEVLGGRLPLARLLEEAEHFARHGIAVTATQAANTATKRAELEPVPGFADLYLPEGTAPTPGQRFRNPALAETLRRLGRDGLETFYRGDLADAIAADLETAGSPLRREDLADHHARQVAPLSLTVAGHEVFNLPPPTQGLASLLLLGVYERLGVEVPESVDYVHALVEATKRVFRIRDRHIADPAAMSVQAEAFLTDRVLAELAADVSMHRVLPWPEAAPGGDTVWLGAVDAEGRAVSFIQSVYWEFGSGVVLPQTGIVWQNRGCSFSLDPAHHNRLAPGKKPFHTIQPALARLADGRVMVYGTMGGEGQPQTQAMLFSRHVMHAQDLQAAVTAPRWLLGRTWGSTQTNLRIESRFGAELIDALRGRGHDIEVVGPYEEAMGHAGALVRHPGGLIEGAADPRGDGAAAGF